ncbi:MAG: hypothetical protein MUE51_15500 [Thermoleophilia bacterium]|nr:hypothetical protein [Thermoleophilia bacterium]
MTPPDDDEPAGPLDALPDTPWVEGARFIAQAVGQWLVEGGWADPDEDDPDHEEVRHRAGWGVAELGGHMVAFARAMPGRGERTSRERIEEAGERLEQHAFQLIVGAVKAIAAATGIPPTPEGAEEVAGELEERLAAVLAPTGEPPPASDVDRFFGAVEAARTLWYGVGEVRPQEAEAAWRLAVDVAVIAAAPVGLLMAE